MSLWDEYDNQPTSPTGLPAGRLTKQAIVSTTREWLLQDYASALCRALAATRLYRRCYWVDAWGFEQGSNHGRGEGVAPAPPVIGDIVSLSKALAQENKPITLNGLVLDAGKNRRKGTRALQKDATAQAAKNLPPAPKHEVLTLPEASGSLRASWPEIAPTLLKEIEHVPAIFLLNPFGQPLFAYDDLAQLYQRTSAPTELCLLLAHRQIELHVATASRSAVYGATITALLRTDRWKALLGAESGAPFNATGIVDLLRAAMRQHFRWVLPIALSVRVRPARVETAPCTLLFASRHKDSLLSMNDALCSQRRRLNVQSRQGVLGEDWFANQEQERLAEDIQQLRQRTLQQGRAQRARRWPDLRQSLLLENFGQFTLLNYDEIICDLLHDNKVRCEWRQPAPAGTRGCVPGNEDALLWT